MPEMEGSTKAPHISQMFQKFALSFKSKAFELFADEDQSSATNAAAVESETFSLLDSAEEFIAGQKVVVIKPDSPLPPASPSHQEAASQKGVDNSQFNQTLITSLFATISSFEASYLQLQTAHVPFDEEGIRLADKALVSHLQTMSEFKQLYKNYYQNPNFCVEFSTGSCLEFQVNENQGKLRALKSVFNRLQSEIDVKDEEVSCLRRKLEEVHKLNSKLSKTSSNQDDEVLLTVKVFNAMLCDAFRLVHKFTKLLIDLMRKTDWDLDLAASSLYSGVDYAKKGHNRYAFLSYVFLRMLQGFDLESFGMRENGIVCNGNISNFDGRKNSLLKQLVDHLSNSPTEILRKNPDSEFSRFCEGKYQQLIHPTMESSIFIGLEEKQAVMKSWKSLSVFYELFVKMTSSIWTLHKLAFSFDPPVEIFQVERGAEFSIVYMEDVTGRYKLPSKMRPKVGFTVVPGFKINQTVIQSQVYLTGMKCTG
ncbi:hypothetical protein Nepgr_002444 [Nepenthes gracilis]|uniref:DUF641 domain-containing protein n=1 Tax=Nepenthes gracilis TaxID=150966 RepID=A0AAD3RYF7_NEPGR|nr:hypothetical protein Nepgr_002444 [Nepenthes gracilis]